MIAAKTWPSLNDDVHATAPLATFTPTASLRTHSAIMREGSDLLVMFAPSTIFDIARINLVIAAAAAEALVKLDEPHVKPSTKSGLPISRSSPPMLTKWMPFSPVIIFTNWLRLSAPLQLRFRLRLDDHSGGADRRLDFATMHGSRREALQRLKQPERRWPSP